MPVVSSKPWLQLPRQPFTRCMTYRSFSFTLKSLVLLDSADSMGRDRHRVAGDRLATRSGGHAHTREYPPLLIPIRDAEDQEGVLDNRACRLDESHRQHDVGLRIGRDLAPDRCLRSSKPGMGLD